jgi:hypothetical protein
VRSCEKGERHPDDIDALLLPRLLYPEGFSAYTALKPGGCSVSQLSAAGDGPGRTNVMAMPSLENL